jgi:hypothetical protein
MITGELYSLREAADELAIDTWRLARLGRYLGVPPAEKLLPRQDVQHIKETGSPDERYQALLHWLLSTLQGAPEHRLE